MLHEGARRRSFTLPGISAAVGKAKAEPDVGRAGRADVETLAFQDDFSKWLSMAEL